MKDKFRLILVGAGRIGAQSHLPAILACGGTRLVAIVDPVRERAAKLARDYGIPSQACSDLEAVLGQADAAIIATPNETHYELVGRCLARGVHVLVEKPMTSTYAEALDACELAGKVGRQAMVGYVTRHRRNVRLMKTLLQRRYFGRVLRFAYQFGTKGGWAPLAGYVSEAGSRRAGVLAISGSHFLDRMLWFWGYPTDMAYADDGENGPEANCIAKFEFEGGLQGSLRCSKTADLPGGLVLDTEMGRVILREDDDSDIMLLPNGGQGLRWALKPEDEGAPQPDPFVAQVSDFMAACTTGRGFGCDFRQGAISMRLIEDLYARRELLVQDWYAAPDSGECQ